MKTVMFVLALTTLMSSNAFAIAKGKNEDLGKMLNASFKEKDTDQSSYRSNDAAVRPDERVRHQLHSISVEIGDELAGRGQLRKETQPL